MAVPLSGQNRTHFWSNWEWPQWLGVTGLIFLGCLNLIWPLPVLILSAALLVLLCCLIRPYAALVLTIFLFAFEGFSLVYATGTYVLALGPGYYMGLLAFFCWCAARLAGLTAAFETTTLDLPLIILYITCIIALLWTPYLREGLPIVVLLTFCYALYIVICGLNSTARDLEKLFWLWYGLGIFVVIASISTFFFGWSNYFPLSDHFYFGVSITQFKGTRESFKGFMGVPKATATLLNISIFCGLSLLCTRVRRSSKILIFAGILSMLFIHFLAISRIEAIGLFLGWLTFATLNPQWHNLRIRRQLTMAVTVLAVFLVVMVFLSAFYAVGVTELFARAIGQEQTAGTGYRFSGVQSRWDHYAYALSATWETAGIGAGTGGIMRGMDPSISVDSPSFYFSFLTDHGYGILSLILAGWLIVNLVLELRWALQNCPDPRFKIFIIGVCSALVMYGSPIADVFFYNFEMWALLGFAAVAVKAVRRLLRSSPPTLSQDLV
jgi:hypothetical protein